MYKKISAPSFEEMTDMKNHLNGLTEKLEGYPLGNRKTFSKTNPTYKDNGEHGDLWLGKDGRVFLYSVDQWCEYDEESAKWIRKRMLNGVELIYIDLNIIENHNRFMYIELDMKQIGTSKYQGHASFWAYEYRHTMRLQRREIVVKIHDALLDSGLDVSGVSDKHLEIIDSLAEDEDTINSL